MSASPLCEDLDNIRRAEDAGAGAIVLHSLFEEQIDDREPRLDHHLSHGTRQLRRGAHLLPRHDRVQPRAGGVSRARPAGQGGGRHPGDRQPQRVSRRGLDRVRAADRAGRGGRPRAERLLRPDRPAHARCGRGAHVPGPRARRACRGDDPGGGEAGPVFQRHRQHGDAAGPGRASTGWCSSTASTSPTSTSSGSRWCRTSCSAAPRELRLRCAGSRSSTAACTPTWPRRAASTPPRTC